VTALVVVVVLFALFWLARRLVHSPFGMSLRGIKQNVVRMPALGTPVHRRIVELGLRWDPGGLVGFVVGATDPAAIAGIRAAAPHAPLLLPGCVARARQQCPTVTLKVVEGFSPQLLDALLTGRLDLALMTNPPRTTALTLTPLCSEPLVVLSPPGARGTRHAFSLAELCATPFIMTVGIRTLVEQQLAGFGGGLRVEAVVDSVEAIRRLLISGVGMTIMPVSAFHDEIRAGRLAAYPIEEANLHRILILARPVAEVGSAAIDEIERIVRGEMADLIQAGFFRMPAADRMAASRRPAVAKASAPKRRARRARVDQ